MPLWMRVALAGMLIIMGLANLAAIILVLYQFGHL
jgi:hypothetical protein